MASVEKSLVSVEKEVDRILLHLRNTVSARGFTQLEVQERLDWGRSYLSQLLTKQKTLRIQQLFLVLAVVGAELGEFFAELYHWPVPSTEDREGAERPPEPALEDAEREINRVIGFLLTKIRERGLTQTKVQKRLGWGRNYISHLANKSKHLRLEQVLAILTALEIEAGDFFFELYYPAEFRAASQAGREDETREIRRELNHLRSMVRLFGRLLVEKGWLAEEEIPPDIAERLRS